VTGKEPSDLAKRKKTLPVLYALEHASEPDRVRLLAIYDRPDRTPEEVAELRAILGRSGAADYTRTEARRLRDEALAALDATGVVQGAARDRLREIIVAAISA
jgi:geranylgeranyl pyrophosphate synthase